MSDAIAPAVAGIRSRARVRDLGEVYTPTRIVDAMLNLVGTPTHVVSTRFLEPSCGNGNFLVEILRRKALAIEKEEEFFTFDPAVRLMQALATISAIDICPGNVKEARARMLAHALGWHRYLEGAEASWIYMSYYMEIIEHKIIVGDFLKREGVLHDITVTDDGVIAIRPVPLKSIMREQKPKRRRAA